MKRWRADTLILLLAVAFFFFCCGYRLGSRKTGGEIRVITSRTAASETASTAQAEDSPAPSTAVTVPAGTERLNLNNATVDELMQLPGIGEVLAQRIVDYREKVGSFQSVQELDEVEGIGQKRLAELMEYLYVTAEETP